MRVIVGYLACMLAGAARAAPPSATAHLSVCCTVGPAEHSAAIAFAASRDELRY